MAGKYLQLSVGTLHGEADLNILEKATKLDNIFIGVISFNSFHFLTFFSSPCMLCHSVMSNSLRPHGLLACQSPLSMRFPSISQEYWNGLPFPPPEDLLHPWIEPMSPASPALVSKFFITEPPGKLWLNIYFNSVLVSTSLLVPSSKFLVQKEIHVEKER